MHHGHVPHVGDRILHLSALPAASCRAGAARRAAPGRPATRPPGRRHASPDAATPANYGRGASPDASVRRGTGSGARDRAHGPIGPAGRRGGGRRRDGGQPGAVHSPASRVAGGGKATTAGWPPSPPPAAAPPCRRRAGSKNRAPLGLRPADPPGGGARRLRGPLPGAVPGLGGGGHPGHPRLPGADRLPPDRRRRAARRPHALGRAADAGRRSCYSGLPGQTRQALAAIVGGAGFGTFIDELGKFITSDNDYFFRPTDRDHLRHLRRPVPHLPLAGQRARASRPRSGW